jgi:ribosomal protein S18 acetylase RimI-like enzyme
MELEICEADFSDPSHCAGIVEVLDSYASDPVGGGKPLSPEVRARLAPALRDHPSALVLLAFSDRRPVGIAVGFFGLSTFQARPLLNIHDLAVVPECRGRGVGRALLEAAEARALGRACCKLTLEVQDDNRRARALYESFGFADFAIGDSAPTRFLTKPLGAPARASAAGKRQAMARAGLEADIRELEPGDLDALLEAYGHLHPEDDPLPPRDELELLWERICADPALIYIGAFDGPTLVATCTAAIVPNLTRGARPYAVVENVVTHPAFQRRGLGSAVLQELLSRCWAAGCYKVMLLSASQRGAAHEFYERNGFDKHAKQGFVIRR